MRGELLITNISQLRDSEQGVAILLCLGLIVCVLFSCLLCIDAARLIQAHRVAQDFGDSASLAGVQQLMGTDKLTGWKRIKPAVLAALSVADKSFLNPAVQAEIRDKTLRFTEGSVTQHDEAGYDRELSSLVNGNLEVTVHRGIFCYNSSGVGDFYSLEALGACSVANAVRVSIRIRNIPAFFAGVVGVSPRNDVVATSVARLGASSTDCGNPPCASYDQDAGAAGIQFGGTCP